MRQEQRSFLCLNERFSFHEIPCLHIYEIFEKSHGIRQVETRCLLNLKLSYDFLDGFTDPSMHAPLIGSCSDFREEETRDP